ncbi:MAG: nitrate/nitrite transporter NrtS [Pseudomonadota bacterium]
MAMIVGPIIALINHGDAIWTGTVTQGDLLKIGVTFFVPFCVSLTSSQLAIRQTVH